MTTSPSNTPHVLILAGDTLLAAPLPPAIPGGDSGGAVPSAPRPYLLRSGPLDLALAPILETLPRRVPLWFLLPDAWCQTLTISASTLAPLPPDQRLAALAYEAEAFSGLSPATTATATDLPNAGDVAGAPASPLPCRILQVPLATVDAIRRACATARHPLAGITHPALLLPPDAPDPAPFSPDTAPAVLRLLSDRLHATPPAPPPAIRPAAPPDPYRRATRILLLAGAALLLLALLAAAILPLRTRTLRAALAERTALATQARRLRDDETALRTAAATLQSDFDATLAPRLALAELRAAPARLLDALTAAHSTPDDALMLRSITSPDPFTYDLATLALTPTHLDALYSTLTRLLPPPLYTLAPQSTRSLSSTPSGAPYLATYRITIHPDTARPGENAPIADHALAGQLAAPQSPFPPVLPPD